jgi:hypothetical protein
VAAKQPRTSLQDREAADRQQRPQGTGAIYGDRAGAAGSDRQTGADLDGQGSAADTSRERSHVKAVPPPGDEAAGPVVTYTPRAVEPGPSYDQTHTRLTFYCPNELLELMKAEVRANKARGGRLNQSRILVDGLVQRYQEQGKLVVTEA